MKMRAPDRRDPRSKLAGWIGTLVVHAAAALFLVQPGADHGRHAAVLRGGSGGGPGPDQRTADRARSAAHAAAGGEAGAGRSRAPSRRRRQPPKPEPKPSGADPARPRGDRLRPRPRSRPRRGETPSTGTDVATIKTPGLEFPFPEYLRNIVTQVYQRWDREAEQGNFAEISFLILRDGSVRDIRFVTRSGSFAFDLDAQGAIEAAGNSVRSASCPTAGRRTCCRSASTSSPRHETTSCHPAARSRRRDRWPLRTRPGWTRRCGSGWTTPGVRPGLVVLPGAGLDSVRAIVRRDLDYSDRFEMITVADSAATRPGGSGRTGGWSGQLRDLQGPGAEFAVELSQAAGGVTARLHDINGQKVRNQQTFRCRPADPDFRLEVHRLVGRDRPVGQRHGGARPRAACCSCPAAGYTGPTATAHDITPLTPAGQTALSPAWSPDGQRIAYTQLGAGAAG